MQRIKLFQRYNLWLLKLKNATVTSHAWQPTWDLLNLLSWLLPKKQQDWLGGRTERPRHFSTKFVNCIHLVSHKICRQSIKNPLIQGQINCPSSKLYRAQRLNNTWGMHGKCNPPATSNDQYQDFLNVLAKTYKNWCLAKWRLI